MLLGFVLGVMRCVLVLVFALAEVWEVSLAFMGRLGTLVGVVFVVFAVVLDFVLGVDSRFCADTLESLLDLLDFALLVLVVSFTLSFWEFLPKIILSITPAFK